MQGGQMPGCQTEEGDSDLRTRLQIQEDIIKQLIREREEMPSGTQSTPCVKLPQAQVFAVSYEDDEAIARRLQAELAMDPTTLQADLALARSVELELAKIPTTLCQETSQDAMLAAMFQRFEIDRGEAGSDVEQGEVTTVLRFVGNNFGMNLFCPTNTDHTKSFYPRSSLGPP